MAWITVTEYCKKKGIKNTQLIYNQIYIGKLKKDEDWKEIEVIKKVKLVKYENS